MFVTITVEDEDMIVNVLVILITTNIATRKRKTEKFIASNSTAVGILIGGTKKISVRIQLDELCFSPDRL